MVPEGFVSWESPLRPFEDDEIAVLRADLAISRGVASELSRLYGESILAWRREAGFPPISLDPTWRRFPDDLPSDGQTVTAAFVDTIGWRALGRNGMGERRFEPSVLGTCRYRAGYPFGIFIQRTPLRGRQSIDDARQWAVYAWRPA